MVHCEVQNVFSVVFDQFLVFEGKKISVNSKLISEIATFCTKTVVFGDFQQK